MEFLLDLNLWASLITLTALEIILGIDNIIFISILCNKLPESQRDRARRFGLMLALITRLLLLATLSWLAGLTKPLFFLLGRGVSWRDIVLIGGGLFLLAKGTTEIHETMEGAAGTSIPLQTTRYGMMMICFQIMVLDIVFSLDSVITAVGMTNQLGVMATAIIIAVIVMLFASGPLSHFINKHITLKMLALSFLILIGVVLIADGLGFHVPRGYIYFAFGFSIGVEILNIITHKKIKSKKAQ
jgi:predicted tellurium resistance membrane protein TerC